jgi:hypothetical protein
MFRRKFIDRLKQKYQTGGFDKAFAKAKQSKQSVFTWNGKEYNTTTSDDLVKGMSPNMNDDELDYLTGMTGKSVEGASYNHPKPGAWNEGRTSEQFNLVPDSTYPGINKKMVGNFGRGDVSQKATREMLKSLMQEQTSRTGYSSDPLYFMIDKPEGFQTGGIYDQMKQYQMGGEQLPGGEVEPIPGTDAVQFNGASHDEGGIMIDDQTEVEGGETMDQVTMAKNGGKRKDYFFSDHLKEKGVSYANMHKEILAEGGDQEKIDYLAQMQEKAAGRSPGKIQAAEHGGVKEYEDGGMPLSSKLAGAAQLGASAYSYFHKQPEAEQATYTPGFTSPIIAERGKASTLDRVDYNNERATNASDMRGVNRFIETSGGGPANIINKMAAYNQKQKGDSKINAAETRANTQISNQEAGMEQQMAINNMSRAQQASTTNMQAIRAEAARRDQINSNNAGARQKVKDDEEFMKYQGVAATATGIAGIVGDSLDYKSDERLARALGSNGVYDRDKLMSYFLKTKNPETGKKYTSEEAKIATREMYNKNNPKDED